MLLSFIRRIVAPPGTREADSLIRDHGKAPACLARQAAGAAEGQSASNHLHRVLAEVERLARRE